ncbi:MAG: hypothetical protein HXX09_12750 [Bacteroidetes bacterium]|nr:hypothetical protein [Bacteroidota bacterium]
MAKTTTKTTAKTKVEDEVKVVTPSKDKATSEEKSESSSIERKLLALYQLQQIDSQIDKIRIIRGELPLEVQDLEDEIAGLETRISNLSKEVQTIDEAILEKQEGIKECLSLIKRYETQQMNVRNNREYDSLTKEIEYQNLEIQLCEKRIKEFKIQLDLKKDVLDKSSTVFEERSKDFETKKAELTDIVAETEKEESVLVQKSIDNQGIIEDRLLSAYKKIRTNARNGLALVTVERDACGGCFNKIPPQRQLDIKMKKKIIVCEYCGRILIDSETVENLKNS